MIDWDPEIDTPATVLVIGGNATGIEAALYARFLGYAVIVVEKGRVGRDLGEQQEMVSWSAMTSPLGLAALEAQTPEATQSMRGEGSVTLAEYAEKYLVPLAKTDLLYESIQINSEVRSVSRFGLAPGRELPPEQRAELDLRVLIHAQNRGEYMNLADIVLDCVGMEFKPGMATGGGLVRGETELNSRRQSEGSETVLHGLIESQTALQSLHLGARDRVVVFGDGEPTREAIVRLLEKVEAEEQARLVWLVPDESALSNDPRFVKLLASEVPRCSVLETLGIEELRKSENGPWVVAAQISLEESFDLECDCFVNLHDLREGPGCWFQPTPISDGSGKSSVLTQEPNYYLLRGSADVKAPNLAGIRQAFALIGGRAELDLYQTVASQPKS